MFRRREGKRQDEAADTAPDAQGTGSAATKALTAADPEDPRKPDSPTELTKPSWAYIARATAREFGKDQCTDLAAALTYYGVLSLFPALLAIVSLLGLLGQSGQTVDTLLNAGRSLGLGSAMNGLRGPIEQLTAAPGAGLALIVGVATALWSASKYVAAFGRALNRIYEVDEGRPFWKLRPIQLILTLVMVLLAVLVGLGLVVSGPVAKVMGDFLGLGQTAVNVWNIAKWPVVLVVVVVMVALLYQFTPNVRQPKFRWISLGATVAILTWVLASAAFGFYVSKFGSYNKTYGSLAGVIVFLLWLWITNSALLLGAELDAELERGRELQAGIEAERTLQLPPRDTRVSAKKVVKLEEAVEKGREIRLAHSADRSDTTDDSLPD